MLEDLKRTDIGLVSKDWIVQPLKNLTSNLIDNRGKTPPYKTKNESVELIETASISFVTKYPDYNKITKFVSEKVYNNWFRAHPVKDDILVSTVGEYSGSTAIMQETRGTIAQNLIAIRIIGANPMYIFYCTRSTIFKRQLEQVMMNHAQPSLRVPWLLNFKIPVPPTTKEQELIITILNDVDSLITQLDKLIAKKRAIKQGAMQELLKPKDGWETKLITDIVIKPDGIKIGPFGSSLKKELLLPKGYKVYGQENIFEKDMSIGNRFISKEHFEKLKACELLTGDFIISMMGTIGKCMIVPHQFEQGIMDSHLIRIRLNSKLIDTNYLLHFFASDYLLNQVNKFSVGGIMAGLSSKIIQQIAVPLPPKKQNQTLIAQILSDMDAELEALEKKLEKYRMIKQGMMQVLLTGKVRLI